MRILLWTTTLLLRAYPARFREVWAGECLQTFQESCADISERRGRLALLRHAIAEWVDMLRGAIRLRRSVLGCSHEPGQPWRSVRQDFWSALRGLRAVPAHTAIALGTLAIGIGASAGLFSVLDSLLFRPMPFAESHRMVELLNLAEESKVQFPGFSHALLKAWRSQKDLFDSVEAYEHDWAVFDGPTGAEMVDMANVTPGIFTLLDVVPLGGRVTIAESGNPTVLVSERLWRSRFGSRSDFVGSSLAINGRPHHVLGLLPASFHFPYKTTEMWVIPGAPVKAASPRLLVLARLAPDVSLERAQSEVTSRGGRLRQGVDGDTGVTAVILPKGPRDEKRIRILQVLGAAAGLLLLIVCANLASLSLARALARSGDSAVRFALGASRADLIRESMVEQLLLGLVGSGLGLLVARMIVTLANVALPETLTLDSLNPIDVDRRVWLMGALAGIATPLLFGLPAALINARTAAATLAQRSWKLTVSRSAQRWRNTLVVAEVVLAVVLLFGAALMGRTVLSLISTDRGFDTHGLVALRVGLPAPRYVDPLRRDQFSEALIAALASDPAVTRVTVGNVPPTPSGGSYGALEFAHLPGQATERSAVPWYRVWPDYFDRIGLRLVEGRTFAETEPETSVIVSETFARKYWPIQSAIGGQFRFTGSREWRTIVGVSAEVRQGGLDDDDGTFEWFVPLRTVRGSTSKSRLVSEVIAEHRTFIAHASDRTAGLAAMQRAVNRLDPTVVIWKTSSIDQTFAEATAQPRLVLIVLGTLGVVGLLLASAGLYGVLSYLVTLRRREFGVRLALGARPGSVFLLIMRQGILLAGLGVAIGAVTAVSAVPVMQSVLYEVEPSDPFALAAVTVVLAVTALAACWRPARRAMRVDPVTLLRE